MGNISWILAAAALLAAFRGDATSCQYFSSAAARGAPAPELRIGPRWPHIGHTVATQWPHSGHTVATVFY